MIEISHRLIKDLFICGFFAPMVWLLIWLLMTMPVPPDKAWHRWALFLLAGIPAYIIWSIVSGIIVFVE
jgi:hypothetical protein